MPLVGDTCHNAAWKTLKSMRPSLPSECIIRCARGPPVSFLTLMLTLIAWLRWYPADPHSKIPIFLSKSIRRSGNAILIWVEIVLVYQAIHFKINCFTLHYFNTLIKKRKTKFATFTSHLTSFHTVWHTPYFGRDSAGPTVTKTAKRRLVTPRIHPFPSFLS